MEGDLRGTNHMDDFGISGGRGCGGGGRDQFGKGGRSFNQGGQSSSWNKDGGQESNSSGWNNDQLGVLALPINQGEWIHLEET